MLSFLFSLSSANGLNGSGLYQEVTVIAEIMKLKISAFTTITNKQP